MFFSSYDEHIVRNICADQHNAHVPLCKEPNSAFRPVPNNPLFSVYYPCSRRKHESSLVEQRVLVLWLVIFVVCVIDGGLWGEQLQDVEIFKHVPGIFEVITILTVGKFLGGKQDWVTISVVTELYHRELWIHSIRCVDMFVKKVHTLVSQWLKRVEECLIVLDTWTCFGEGPAVIYVLFGELDKRHISVGVVVEHHEGACVNVYIIIVVFTTCAVQSTWWKFILCFLLRHHLFLCLDPKGPDICDPFVDVVLLIV